MPKTSTSMTTSLPGVGELISESWQTLKRNGGTMLMIWIIGILAYILVGVVLAGGLVATGAAVGLKTGFFQNLQNSAELSSMLLPLISSLGVFVLVFAAIFIVIGAVLEGAVIYAAVQTKSKISVGEAIAVGKSRALPLIGAGVLSALIVVGGFFAFVIPGLVFSVLFSMVAYEVVIGKTGILKSISVSAGMVKEHFWDVLGRILVLVGISLLVAIAMSVIRGILTPMVGRGSAEGIAALIRFVVNIGVSLFAIVYATTLYQQLRAVSTRKSMSLLWPAILAVIGWIIGIFIMSTAAVALSQVIKNWPELMKAANEEQNQNSDDRNLQMMMDMLATPQPSGYKLPSASPVPPKAVTKPAPAMRY